MIESKYEEEDVAMDDSRRHCDRCLGQKQAAIATTKCVLQDVSVQLNKRMAQAEENIHSMLDHNREEQLTAASPLLDSERARGQMAAVFTAAIQRLSNTDKLTGD